MKTETSQKGPILMPVCPHCRTEMRPEYFTGYYESFAMWQCECYEIPSAEEVRGCYA